MSAVAEERIVRLLDEDADLAERIAREHRPDARTALLVRVVALSAGADVDQALSARWHGASSLLLLAGLVGRVVRLGETATVQLLGPGDMMEIRGRDAVGGGLVPVTVSWTVLETTTVALLDDALLQRAQRWPELQAALLERASVQSLRLATLCAISSLARVEDRIETLLWFLAERWGRIGSHGVVLPLRLTHETLGLMLGAKRPTVSLALKQLAADDLVERRDDGAWLLRRRHGEQPLAVERPGGGIRVLARHADEAAPAAGALTVSARSRATAAARR
jgi:CRP-like cAMP-binding protein